MTEIQHPKRYDLEERTFAFAKRIVSYVKKLPKTLANIEIRICFGFWNSDLGFKLLVL